MVAVSAEGVPSILPGALLGVAYPMLDRGEGPVDQIPRCSKLAWFRPTCRTGPKFLLIVNTDKSECRLPHDKFLP